MNNKEKVDKINILQTSSNTLVTRNN